MLKSFSLLLLGLGLLLGPVYWVYVVYFTGKVADTIELRPGAQAGRWVSQDFRLSPEMGPVGLILLVDGYFAPNMDEGNPPHDAYHAVVFQDGREGQPIRFELAVKSVSDSNPRFRERLLLLKQPRSGTYRLELDAAEPPDIRLDHVKLEVRSQVRETDNRLVAAGIILVALGVLGLLL